MRLTTPEATDLPTEALPQGYKHLEQLRIMQDDILRKRIAGLFMEEEIYAHDIVQRLDQELHLNKNAAPRTNEQIVRNVIMKTVPHDKRILIEARQRHRKYEDHAANLAEKRRQKFEEEHRVIFSPDEWEYLREKVEGGAFLTAKKETDYITIAAILNKHFDTTRFTNKNCRQKYQNYYRDMRLRVAKLQTLGLLSQKDCSSTIMVSMTTTTSELCSDIFRQLNDSIAVAPLVVVPPEDLGKVLAHDLRESGIDDAAAAITDNILGNNGTILHTENSFQTA